MKSSGNILPQLFDPSGKSKNPDEFNFKMRSSLTEIQIKLPDKKRSSRENPTLMHSMTQKNFIKDFSSKLQKHQTDIERRDEFIKELELTLDRLKIEYVFEKQISDDKSRLLRESQEIQDKLTTRLKTNQIKMEELMSQVQFYEKEISKIKEDEQRQKQGKEKESQMQKIIEDLEQKTREQEAKMNSESALKKQQFEDIQNKLELSVANIKKELEAKIKELSSAQEKIKTHDEEKKLAESNIQNLRRQSTMKLQEFEFKAKEAEVKARELNAILEENSKLSSNLKEIKAQNEKLQALQNASLAQCTSLQENVQQMKNENETLQQQLIASKQQITSLEGILTQKNEKMANMLKELENTRNKQNSNDKSAAENKQLLSTLQKKYDDSTQSLTTLQSQLSNISKCSRKLEEAEKEITKSLKCNFCDQFIKDPITIIPCGHSFCLNCKKAYAKDCIRCGPKVKVEAMYRNELLDDIIGMVKIMQSLQQALKS